YMKRSSLFLLLFLIGFLSLNAQVDQVGREHTINTITTAVPFLMIAPDARAGAMGDAGVASSPDANSMHWNPAKYAFVDKQMGFSLSFSPWLRKLVNDIYLGYLTGYYKIDDRQTVAMSLRYFSLGEILFTDEIGNPLNYYSPYEFALDGTYARKFSEKWSGGVAARFIYSNLTQGQFVGGSESSAGISVAADVSIYYQNDIEMGAIDGVFAWGLNISNIGTKISYSQTNIEKDFIPTNFRIGPSLKINIDEYNSMTFTLDINKLLVPTPPYYLRDENGPVTDTVTGELIIAKGMDPNVSVVQGMIQSWYDAPGGFSEEMREFSFAGGIEYWYNNIFSIRGGFFYEDKTKGNRKFFTLGAGLKYNVFGLDFAYLIPLEQHNPLENTLRFSLLFDFDAFKGQN
ncbi:MAG: type IX secretion system outer membrane channel protein PorV, partial [Bacteroidales bacterium]|nr:type IX secretion system outer membrane channel protein PorV [Bacteroidales bacterium]